MRHSPFRAWLPATLLLCLLAVLAWLQVRWIGAVSDAERDRLRAGVRRAASAAARPLDAEVSTLAYALAPGPPRRLDERLSAWREATDHPEVLESILRVELRAPTERRAPAGPALEVRRLDEDTGELVPVNDPELLRSLRRAIRESARSRDQPVLIDSSLPAVLVRSGGSPRGRHRRPESRGFTVLVLGRDALAEVALTEVFPILQRELGNDFAFRLLDRSGEVVAAPDDASPSTAETLRLPVLGLMPLEELRRLRAGEDPVDDSLPEGVPPQRSPGPRAAALPGAWVLEVWYRDGTLESAVARVRLLNLGLSAAILLVLAAAVIHLARSAARDRRAAQRQLDFVAGVTHELHTPLAAISSAGANLADGVVSDPDRVREYGNLVRRESDRLGRLVSQALELAGMEGARGAEPRERIAGRELILEALEQNRLAAAENDVEVTTSAPTDAAAMVRRETFVRALGNLLSNSIKHGARRVAITATEGAGGRLQFAVDDDGPGIDPRDEPHLFDAYTRGSSAEVPGTGLGLHLAARIAERHGGALLYDGRGPLGGARFRLDVPAAPASSTGDGRPEP